MKIIKLQKTTHKEQLLELVNLYKHSHYRLLTTHPELSELLQFVLTSTKFLNSYFNITTRIKYILENKTNIITCANCNKPIYKNISLRLPFPEYCCRNCAIHSKIRAAKIKAAYKNKSEIEKLKISAKIKNSYSIKAKLNPNWSLERDIKTKHTKQLKYNNSTYNNRQSYKQTCMKKYGSNNIFGSTIGKEHIKQTLLQKYNVDNPMKNKDIFRKSKTKYFFNNIYFHSKPELALYIWCKDHNLNFQYQPNISFEYQYNNKIHQYFPDFIIDGKLYEIKGDQFFKEDGTMQNPYNHNEDALYEAKHQCMIKNNIIILKYSQYKKYLDYIKTKGKFYDKNTPRKQWKIQQR